MALVNQFVEDMTKNINPHNLGAFIKSYMRLVANMQGQCLGMGGVKGFLILKFMFYIVMFGIAFSIIFIKFRYTGTLHLNF